ncbi:M48 family metallopeptidase [Massilia solisilvae]|uniref:M48 family metallopeptidase n=1 Tax=Massilia solisilvae TaxID=1811225 RepID=A0ABT2BF18_9BURK|nr:M48 family metallopeptidase [Massilia solisilvae]MCS0607119.1 M48 family metallopeptidase [Massilia solisilvae]
MTSAIYFDGQSARMHRVELETSAGTVVVAGPGIARIYPSGQARLAEPFAGAPAVVYFSDGARCEVTGAAHAELAGALGYRATPVVRWQARWPAALAALVLLLLVLAATLLWGLPAATEMIAARLPASVDASMGKSVLASLERQQILTQSRFSDQRLAAIDNVMARVMPPHPRVPIRLLVRSSRALGANALALPDGTIVLTDDMVKLILGKRADFGSGETAQLAGVLAHEIGHIEQRHSARTLARTSLTAALSAALFGDFSAAVAGVPAVLMKTSYSRAMETEADLYAIKALHAQGMPTEPLADLFYELENTPRARATRSMPRWLSKSLEYTASHPSSAERIERLLSAQGR